MALTFDETLDRLGSTTKRSVQHVIGLHEAGTISTEIMQQQIQTILEIASAQGANYGQISYSLYAESVTGELPAVEYSSKLAKDTVTAATVSDSLETVISDGDNMAMRLERLAENMPVEIVQDIFGKSMAKDERAQGWIRGLEPDACELCTWWWKEGRIWPKEHPMPTHPGCRCQQIPEYSTEIAETAKSRAARKQREWDSLTAEQKNKERRRLEHIADFYQQQRQSERDK